MPKTLSAIEADCVPWHYLVERRRYSEKKVIGFFDTTLSFVRAVGAAPVLRARNDSAIPINEFPTLDELNAVDRPEMDAGFGGMEPENICNRGSTRPLYIVGTQIHGRRFQRPCGPLGPSKSRSMSGITSDGLPVPRLPEAMPQDRSQAWS